MSSSWATFGTTNCRSFGSSLWTLTEKECSPAPAPATHTGAMDEDGWVDGGEQDPSQEVLSSTCLALFLSVALPLWDNGCLMVSPE